MNDQTKDYSDITVTLPQFLCCHGLKLTTFETVSGNAGASIDAAIIEGSISRGCVGFGQTPDEAKNALVQQIKGRRLSVLFRHGRHEITVPRFLRA